MMITTRSLIVSKNVAHFQIELFATKPFGNLTTDIEGFRIQKNLEKNNRKSMELLLHLQKFDAQWHTNANF